MALFERTENIFVRLASGLAIFGGLGLIFATFVTCASIILRLMGRLYNALFGAAPDWLFWLGPILGEEELVTYGIGLALFAALPWVMIKRGHITVDLFKNSFSKRTNKVLDLIGDILLASIAYLILTRQWTLIFKPARRSQEGTLSLFFQGDFEAGFERMRTAQESQILGLPLWPTYIVAEICVLIFFMTACFCVIRSARNLMKLEPHHG